MRRFSSAISAALSILVRLINRTRCRSALISLITKDLKSDEALAAVQGAGSHRGPDSAAARRGGEQDVGLHQEEQPAEPREQARDPRRRQAEADLRQAEGDHVRDEQAPRPASLLSPTYAMTGPSLQDSGEVGALLTVQSATLDQTASLSSLAGRKAIFLEALILMG